VLVRAVVPVRRSASPTVTSTKVQIKLGRHGR
jgi:hypothetical protein